MEARWNTDIFDLRMGTMKPTVIEVPIIPRGPNGRIGLLRMPWYKLRKYNKEWMLWIRANANLFPRAAPVVRLKVHIHQIRKKKLDPDNLCASCKPILDALTSLNFIHDDSEEWIDFIPPTQKTTKETGKQLQTIITIEAQC